MVKLDDSILISVDYAYLKKGGFGFLTPKPNPYVVLMVDDESSQHKCKTIKKTYRPYWNEAFYMYVYSIMVKISYTHINNIVFNLFSELLIRFQC